MKRFIAGLLSVYKKAISPFLGNCCRFHPSCSDYAREAVLKKGVLTGFYLAAARLLKCQPFYPGGFDPVE